MKKFFNHFDQTSFLSLLLFTCLLFVLIMVLSKTNLTLSKYQSGAISTAKAKVAYFVVNPGKYENGITLSGLEPSDTPYLYQINISNFDEDNNQAQVNLKYNIKFIFTTNLPLSFKIIRNTDYTAAAVSIMNSEVTTQDSDNTYFKTLSNSETYYMNYDTKTTDVYTLIVNFPKTYQNDPDKYQGLIDSCTVEINAEQV